MTKNEIVQQVLESLMKQRLLLTQEVTQINHNEATFQDKKMTLEFAISNLDMRLDSLLMQVEYINPSK